MTDGQEKLVVAAVAIVGGTLIGAALWWVVAKLIVWLVGPG